MADVINLNAEDNRNIIDDDAVPTLSLDNTNASGSGLKVEATGGGTVLDVNAAGGIGIDLDGTTGIGIDIDNTTGTGIDVLTGGTAGVFKSSASTGYALDVSRSVVGSPTVAPMKVTVSAASGAVFEFNSPLISTASLSVIAGAFPVKMTGEDKVVYLVGFEIA